MPVRRTLFAFLVTFACALLVFTLPRFVSNTILGAAAQSQSKDTVPAAAATQDATAPPVRGAPPPAPRERGGEPALAEPQPGRGQSSLAGRSAPRRAACSTQSAAA